MPRSLNVLPGAGARPDQRTGNLDGVVVFILGRVVVEVEGRVYSWTLGDKTLERCIPAAK